MGSTDEKRSEAVEEPRVEGIDAFLDHRPRPLFPTTDEEPSR